MLIRHNLSTDFQDFRDSQGFYDYGPLPDKADGGDTLAFTCMVAAYTDIITASEFEELISQLHCGDGNYRRHPTKGWASQCDVMSRDQSEPLILALGKFNSRRRLKEYALGLLKRGGFMTNKRINGDTTDHKKIPDTALPQTLANLIRAFNFWPMWPALLVLDLFLLGGTIINVFQKDFDPTAPTTLHLASIRLSTPAAWLSRQIFVRFTNVEKLWYKYCRRQYANGHFPDGYSPPPFHTLWPSLRTKLLGSTCLKNKLLKE